MLSGMLQSDIEGRFQLEAKLHLIRLHESEIGCFCAEKDQGNQQFFLMYYHFLHINKTKKKKVVERAMGGSDPWILTWPHKTRDSLLQRRHYPRTM